MKKEEIQNKLKKTISDYAKEIKDDKYIIDKINQENDVISEGDENGYIKYRDTGRRTLLINYREKLKENKDMELEEIKKRIDESIQKIECMDEDRAAYQYCWKGEIIEYIKTLEEKYYPKPKPKTIREKINDIINNNNLNMDRTENMNREAIYNDLIKLRDETEEEKPSMTGMGI
jgi:hypothetical protein